jgi:hypothetical protein
LKMRCYGYPLASKHTAEVFIHLTNECTVKICLSLLLVLVRDKP